MREGWGRKIRGAWEIKSLYSVNTGVQGTLSLEAFAEYSGQYPG
jgi:hypothetical protein